MKLFITCLLVCACIISFSQEKIKVITEEKEMSQGVQTAFVVIVPESEIKNVESDWKKYVNKRSVIESVTKGAAGRLIGNTYKSIANAVSKDKEREKSQKKLRVERENNELIVRGIVHKELMQDMLDIYARITQLPGETQVSAFFKFSDSIFISPENIDKETLLSLENYIYEFGVEAYQNVVKGQIKDAEKDLRKMNGELKRLVSKNESMHKDISKMRSDIDKCKSDILLNNKQISRVAESYSETREQLMEHKKESLQYESLKEILKERKKEKRKLMNHNKRLKTKIKKLEVRIKNTFSDIADNNIEQEQQEDVIDGQEEVISQLEEKYNNIG